MADNGLSSDGLSPDEAASPTEAAQRSERRAFLRKAALVGLPVALATVNARTVWAQAQGPSCAQSNSPSGCASINGVGNYWWKQ